MVIFLTALLCASAAGIFLLLTIKRWEMASGRVLFSGLRPAFGRLLGSGLYFVERSAPEVLRRLALSLWATARSLAHRTAAWAVLHTESVLERVLGALRGATQERGSGEASAFLREVAEHKKSLLEGSDKKKNAIYEE